MPGLPLLNVNPFSEKGTSPQIFGGRNGYRDPSQVALHNGMPMAYQLPPSGDSRIRGVIIPKATRWGRSRGFDPEDLSNTELIVDPHIDGGQVTVRLSSITPESSMDAFEFGGEFAESAASQYEETYHDQLEDIELIRLQGAAAMHALANIRQNRGQAGPQKVLPSPEYAEPEVEVSPYQSAPPPISTNGQPRRKIELNKSARGNQPRAQMGPHRLSPPLPPKPASFVPTTGYHPCQMVPPVVIAPGEPPARSQQTQPSMAARFHQKQAAFASPPQPRMIEQSQAVTSPVNPPPVLVTFEVEGFGQQQAYYHDVIRSNAGLALVYDDRFQGPKYFPNAIEKPFVARIEGHEELYFVNSTGLMFKDAQTQRTYCVLLILDKAQDEEDQ